MARDGTANDKTLSFHSQTGTIVGGCEHKPDDINLVLTTPGDGEAVVRAVERGQSEPASSRAMHLAGETVVICFKPIAATEESAPFLCAAAVPTCNKRSSLKMSQELLTRALDGFDAVREPLRAVGRWGLGRGGGGGDRYGRGCEAAAGRDGARQQGEGEGAGGGAVCEAGPLRHVRGQAAADGGLRPPARDHAPPRARRLHRPGHDALAQGRAVRQPQGQGKRSVGSINHFVCSYLWVQTKKNIRQNPHHIPFLNLPSPPPPPRSQELFENYSVPHLAAVFDNTDKQNVGAAVDLFHGFHLVRSSFGYVGFGYV